MEVDFPLFVKKKKEEFWPLKPEFLHVYNHVAEPDSLSGAFWGPYPGGRLCFAPRNLAKERWTHLAYLVEGGLTLLIHS